MTSNQHKLQIIKDITEELVEREIGFKYSFGPFSNLSWEQLCDDGIKLFESLRKDYETLD